MRADALDCRGRLLEFDVPRIMGVLNITPDSFSDGGRYLSLEPSQKGPGRERVELNAVVDAASAMLEDGADILDVGGESTRPGAAHVSAAQELDRVMPVVEALLKLDTIVSVDTSNALVAQETLHTGVHLINDVRALQQEGMVDNVIESGAAVCLMHMQGEPRTMQEQPFYKDVLEEVREFLVGRVRKCRAAGIAHGRIALDPGFGFGKTLDHNLKLMKRLDELVACEETFNRPLLVGVSRKRSIGEITGRSALERDTGSAVMAAFAVQQGAAIVRAHNVGATRDAIRVAEALRTERACCG